MTEINKEYIEERVNDWVQRINTVYSLVKSSLSNVQGVQCTEDKKTQMHEDLMQKYEVSPIVLPILDVNKGNELIASFKPIGLWVIGANGRIDILTRNGSYILVDIADKKAVPDWRVYTPTNRKESVAFNKEFLSGLVE